MNKTPPPNTASLAFGPFLRTMGSGLGGAALAYAPLAQGATEARWRFEAPGWALAAGLAATAVMCFFSVRLWRRYPQRRRALAWLEALRWLTAALIVLTLLRPERVVTTSSEWEPQVAVLCDASASMDTPDVLTPGAPLAQTRRAWLEAALAGHGLDSLKQAYKTTLVPFRSKDGAGTDLSLALDDRNGGLLESFRNLRAVLLLSDGDWNSGDAPVNKAAQLRARGVPVYTVLTGSPIHLPDVALEGIQFPAFCLAREKVAIPFDVANNLPQELRASATLTCEGAVVAQKEVRVSSGAVGQESIVWIPPKVGQYTLTLQVPVQPGEVNPANNARTFKVEVRQEKLRVLVVDSVPRWEYRFLRNALARDPDIAADTLLIQPGLGMGAGSGYLAKFPAREALGRYDVVFVGDIGVGEKELTQEQTRWLRDLVEKQGAGIVFLPGIRGRSASWIGSPLDDMMPVELDPAQPKGIASLAQTRFQLTDAGSGHLLTMLADSAASNALVWRQLPGFTWNAAVKKVRQGTELLAVNPLAACDSGRMPVLAIRPFGSGNSLFMGIDSAWRWRKGVEDLYHYRFWGQVVRWMAHKRHLAHDQGARLFYSPEVPSPGIAIRFNALLHDRAGFPVRQEELKAQLLDPEGKSVETFLMAENGDWGSYEGKATPRQSGRHILKLTGAKSGLAFETTLEVAPQIREIVGRPARPLPLDEIARLTQGASGTTADFAALVAQIKALPQATALEERQPLWSRWWWGATLLALLGLYWSLRKRLGMI